MSNEDHKHRAEQAIAGLNAILGRRLVQPAGRLAPQTTPVVSTTFPPLDAAVGLGVFPVGS